jgi:glycosyltransferase involved in cell wall biosynthesis
MARVSVLIAAKDRPEGLAESLESVAAQTYRDFEAVVVNDGGEDLAEVAGRFSDKFPLVFLRRETSGGLAAARNAALDAASGEIIACLDDDDVFYPDHIQTLVSKMDESGANVAYADAALAYHMNAGGRPEITERKVLFSRDFDPGALMVYNYIPTLCLAYRRRCLGAAGRYCEKLTSLVDWDLFIRLAALQHFEHAPRVTAEYRKLAEAQKRGNLLAAEADRYLQNLSLVYERCAGVARANPRIVREQAVYMLRAMGRAVAAEESAGREGRAAAINVLAAELAAAREDPGRAQEIMFKVRETLG